MLHRFDHEVPPVYDRNRAYGQPRQTGNMVKAEAALLIHLDDGEERIREIRWRRKFPCWPVCIGSTQNTVPRSLLRVQ